eukprot:TRINITY_DN10203_c0_g1_i1.p1 TRINITY_DN10203_c0_g1~~TRINITY_DN10203_c0_g1_i1.p1  ORF type:complete len:143 (-),score=41.87 TRINITY_DN10203_c0_g1_i1:59-487(-)
MKSNMLLTLVQFGLLFLAAEGRKGKSRPQRWWHVAENDVDCGNYTQLMKDERPTDLCLELETSFCICTTRSEPSLASAEWMFKCGTCEIKWRRDRNEDDKDGNVNKSIRKLGRDGQKKKQKEKKKTMNKKKLKAKNKKMDKV